MGVVKVIYSGLQELGKLIKKQQEDNVEIRPRQIEAYVEESDRLLIVQDINKLR